MTSLFGPPARRVRTQPDPVLRTPCAPATDFGPALAALIDDMTAVMHAANGVGLAANQIGVNLAVFVYACPDDTGTLHTGHLVNPGAPVLTGPTVTDNEGCLSIPGRHALVSRAHAAAVTGQDLHGAPFTVAGTGYFARCLQHETDHLNGRLYPDRIR